jgi:hypothetical protein
MTAAVCSMRLEFPATQSAPESSSVPHQPWMDKGVGLRVLNSGPEIVAVDELSFSRLRVSEQGIYGIGGGMACSCWRTAALLEGTWTAVL